MTIKFILAFIYDMVNYCLVFQWLILFLAIYLTTYFIKLMRSPDTDFWGDVMFDDDNIGCIKAHLLFVIPVIIHALLRLKLAMTFNEGRFIQEMQASPVLLSLGTFFLFGSFKTLIASLLPVVIIECIMAHHSEKISNLIHESDFRSTVVGAIITFGIVIFMASCYFGSYAEQSYKDFKSGELGKTNTAYISRVSFIKAIDKNFVS